MMTSVFSNELSAYTDKEEILVRILTIALSEEARVDNDLRIH